MDGSTAQSPIPIAPLIPLPSPTAKQQEEVSDVFATLFSPPTPRASPSPTHTPSVPSSGGTYRPHVRTVSSDSDFGAFVSVPSNEDPLADFTLARNTDTSGSNASYSFFDGFAESARAASERNRREVLDELLREDEEDPLRWLGGSLSPSPAPSPLEVSQEGDATGMSVHNLIDLDFDSSPLDAHAHAHGLALDSDSGRSTPRSTQRATAAARQDSLTDLDDLDLTPDGGWQGAPPHEHQPTAPGAPLPPSYSQSPSPSSSQPQSQLQAQSRPSLNPHQHLHSYPHPYGYGEHVRSPSLPPASPARPSEPRVEHAQSTSTYFTPTSFPSRWVSSLLSSTIRGPRSGLSTPPAEFGASAGTTAAPSTSTFGSTSTTAYTATFAEEPEREASFPTRFASFSRSAPHSRAATVAESALLPDAALKITHGTPFAPQAPYVPPSGAPGFAGDRQWDKGFEFDHTQVERRSVRLAGRREMTVPVLSVELADKLRPFLPALARLPKTWSLLYSLDQNGISLNTLYARCQDFKGSALCVVRDAGETVFGVWMGEGIRPSKGAYYGSGESFLWRAAAEQGNVRVFKWTGRNDYVALCEPDYLSFGGGDGYYGLWLDSALTDGSSARCPTFDNEPLCSAGSRQGETVTFECVGLEVWGIG